MDAFHPARRDASGDGRPWAADRGGRRAPDKSVDPVAVADGAVRRASEAEPDRAWERAAAAGSALPACRREGELSGAQAVARLLAVRGLAVRVGAHPAQQTEERQPGDAAVAGERWALRAGPRKEPPTASPAGAGVGPKVRDQPGAKAPMESDAAEVRTVWANPDWQLVAVSRPVAVKDAGQTAASARRCGIRPGAAPALSLQALASPKAVVRLLADAQERLAKAAVDATASPAVYRHPPGLCLSFPLLFPDFRQKQRARQGQQRSAQAFQPGGRVRPLAMEPELRALRWWFVGAAARERPRDPRQNSGAADPPYHPRLNWSGSAFRGSQIR